ncbi:MAG: peptidase M14 [Bacteroidia bacterium]|nr:peptidase M14 [Bacteroidia bacterium]
MAKIDNLQVLFSLNKEQDLSGRYIHNGHILPIIDRLNNKLEIEIIGKSVKQKPIFCIKIGNGSKRILMWSQMHGNESTTTKSVFDLLNTFYIESNNNVSEILRRCTICIIPILNPDGAESYTRFNANNIDLNRDANDLSQPESKILRNIFDQFKPAYCFNLHGQRTIFSAGNTRNPATVSFLAPAQDTARTVTETRKKAMEIILAMNTTLQEEIRGQVGIYDDSFNINCVGDQFQRLNVPTILFEAGHFQRDYLRENTRELIYYSLITAIEYIAQNDIIGRTYSGYFELPENKKQFYDIILRNAKINGWVKDVAIQFDEVLKNGTVQFVPIVKEIGDLNQYFGHHEIDVEKRCIEILKNDVNKGVEIVIVNKNQENKVLNLIEF